VARAQLESVVRHIRGLAAHEAAEGRTSFQLLHDFLTHQDETAFAALVQRHGPMVLGVCRHVLHHLHDAEDAFQATFLVLARKANSIRRGASLTSWLHGVAFHTAIRAKRDLARRRLHERQAKPMSDAKPSWDLALRELQATVDEEVQRLPEKYRAPFVLCCLESKSKAEAALELGCPVGTVSSRLDQARKRLQQRLTRRGVTLSALLGAAALCPRGSTAAVPAVLANRTIRGALLYAASKTAAAGCVSAEAAALAEGVIGAMFTTKTKIATVLLLAASLATGIGVLAHPPLAAKQVDSKQPGAAKESPAPAGGDPSPVQTDRGDERAEPAFRGRVLGPDGQPFKGAKLYVQAHPSAGEPLLVATTDATGRFQIKVPRALLTDPKTGLPSDSLSVVATAAGYGPDGASRRPGEEAGELELQLAKDDLPLVGRLLDLEGQPVVGAKMSIHSIRAVTGGDLTRLLQDIRTSTTFVWHPPYVHEVFQGPVPGLPRHVTTDEGGRFRLTGIGRERLVEVSYAATPGIAAGSFLAITRPSETITDTPRGITIYGAEFRHLAQPARVITGIVRDKASRKPLAGIKVGNTVTDAEGRYELQGQAKAERYWLTATPTRGEHYFILATLVADQAGFGPLKADLELVPGIPLQGRVTDRVTGKPVRGYVGYIPIWMNPHAKALTQFGYGGEHVRGLSEGLVGADGSFSCCVLPGPGVLVFQTAGDKYLPACVDPAAVFKKPRINAGDKDHLIIDHGGFGGPLGQAQFQALALINPGEGETTIKHDLTVEPSRRVTGNVVGPDGKPLTGVRVVGLPESTLKTDRFTLRGINPARPRLIYFYHDAQQLAAGLLAKGNEQEPLTIRLEKWGTVTGRLVTAEGQPLAGGHFWTGNLDASTPIYTGQLATEKDGSFRIEALVPGLKYKFHFTNPPPEEHFAIGYLDITVKPGQTLDLGTTKGKLYPKR
jgi:RNA polymerase sigma factor (sigma-70 family)